ncbi:hypothetical protein D3C87_1879240 [compost metagenome]
MPRDERSNSGAPTLCSSLFMLKLSVGWVTNSAVAAPLSEPASATARNWVSSLSMTRLLRNSAYRNFL